MELEVGEDLTSATEWVGGALLRADGGGVRLHAIGRDCLVQCVLHLIVYIVCKFLGGSRCAAFTKTTGCARSCSSFRRISNDHLKMGEGIREVVGGIGMGAVEMEVVVLTSTGQREEAQIEGLANGYVEESSRFFRND